MVRTPVKLIASISETTSEKVLTPRSPSRSDAPGAANRSVRSRVIATIAINTDFSAYV